MATYSSGIRKRRMRWKIYEKKTGTGHIVSKFVSLISTSVIIYEIVIFLNSSEPFSDQLLDQ